MEDVVPTINEILSKIDAVASKLEESLNGKVVHLIFHELASITRDTVDDLEFYMNEKFGRVVDGDFYVILHTMGGDPDAAYHIGMKATELCTRRQETLRDST